MNPQEGLNRLIVELQKVIVGQDRLLNRLLIALLCDGHVLLEGVPGLAKTKTLKSLTQCISAQMERVQFTPDLLPSDLVGTEVFSPQSGEFRIRKGPLFTNFLLADEINRAPAKVQSALLQAMEERQVTIGDTTFSLPSPFVVLATQNPIEQEGTYPLPEAQLDRFLMKVRVTYPSYEEELSILTRHFDEASVLHCSPVLKLEDFAQIKTACRSVFMEPRLDRYIVSLIQNSRDGANFGLRDMVDWGASPRGAIALKACARAHAFIAGKNYVSPDDVKEVAADALRHRILPSFEAEAQGVTSEFLIIELLKQTAIP